MFTLQQFAAAGERSTQYTRSLCEALSTAGSTQRNEAQDRRDEGQLQSDIRRAIRVRDLAGRPEHTRVGSFGVHAKGLAVHRE